MGSFLPKTLFLLQSSPRSHREHREHRECFLLTTSDIQLRLVLVLVIVLVLDTSVDKSFMRCLRRSPKSRDIHNSSPRT